MLTGGLSIPLVSGPSLSSKDGEIDQATLHCHSSLRVEPSTFNLRIGPSYESNGKKAPSSDSIFQFVGSDLFKTKRKEFHLGRFIDIDSILSLIPDTFTNKPKSSSELHVSIAGIPKLFYFVTQFPDNSEDSSNEAGFLFAQYFFLSEWAELALSKLQALQAEEDASIQEISPSLLLLQRYIQAPNDDDLKLRFKVVPNIINVNEANLPWALQMALVSSYNGKPFLSRPQHTMHSGPGYYELDLDVYEFNWLSKWALSNFLTGWKKQTDILRRIVGNVGLVIQGDADEELPERLLGCFQLQCIQLDKAIEFDSTVAASALDKQLDELHLDTATDAKE